MNKALTLILAAGLALGGCNAAVQEPPLAGAKLGGPFTLTDQDGRRFSEAQLAGKYRLFYFGYTYCPDVCPLDLQKLMRAYAAFEKSDPARAARLQPLFVTIDPARDTPAVVKTFVSAFHPRLIGLTGSEAEIAAVAKAYGIFYRKEEGATPGSYLVDHARIATLYGPDGQPIALIPQDGTVEDITKALDQWVK